MSKRDDVMAMTRAIASSTANLVSAVPPNTVVFWAIKLVDEVNRQMGTDEEERRREERLAVLEQAERTRNRLREEKQATEVIALAKKNTDVLAAYDRETGYVGTMQPEMAQLRDLLFTPIDELELSVRSANCLQEKNILYVGQLVQATETDLLRVKNFGRKSLKEIKEVLDGVGLYLGMKIHRWDEELERHEALTRKRNLSP